MKRKIAQYITLAVFVLIAHAGYFPGEKVITDPCYVFESCPFGKDSTPLPAVVIDYAVRGGVDLSTATSSSLLDYFLLGMSNDVKPIN